MNQLKINKETFQEIGELFRLPGEVKKVVLLKDGSSAISYQVEYDTKKSYLFQMMKVKKEELNETMDNVEKITSYLKSQNHTLVHFHHTNSKENFIEYNGDCWRVRRFFNEFGFERSDDLEALKELGKSIGIFQYLTRKYDVSQLNPVFQSLHDTESIINQSDDEYVQSVKEKALIVQNAYKKTLVPQRVVTNDAKIKTISLGKKKHFYINLDLTTAGIGLYDFANPCLLFCSTIAFGEGEETKLDIDKYQAYLTGYLSAIGKYLNKFEKDLFVASLFAIAVENIVINAEREQQKKWCISIAKDIESRTDELKAITQKVVEETKTVRVTLSESAIERETPSSSDKQYKAGEYMQITMPHFVKARKGRFYSFIKRFFDIFLSLLAMIILSPLFLIIGILVVTTSRGPMIYVSKRVGKNGRIFNFYKFRSMYKDAEQRLNELLDKNEDEDGVTFKMKNDPRITPFGRFIRKTSIDELPQLLNILKGDMSIIGPRAGLPREVEIYPEEALDRLQVPQGLSGEWQANGRSDTTFENMIKMDLDYVQNKRGFWHDIGLVFKTIWVVITGNGAE